ncbi:DUF397 domain-containing protein [Actinomadura harenae]|uniref:DUF397 domain-containing protein n=1 Tax=Actinomadura harenae TaxID=2483351 RepID=A0A3M2LSZ0_9ACTN|nr:DUF397 domain-containing protein [Actinomadura harenae]RMI40599.1 DUF397 domain-containing protein [Actinomadura harenae]
MSERPTWRKAKASGPEEGACVELADLAAVVGIRDSKDPGAGHLRLSREALASLFREVGPGPG